FKFLSRSTASVAHRGIDLASYPVDEKESASDWNKSSDETSDDGLTDVELEIGGHGKGARMGGDERMGHCAAAADGQDVQHVVLACSHVQGTRQGKQEHEIGLEINGNGYHEAA